MPTTGAKARTQRVKTEVLALVRRLYGADLSDAKLLAFDPNDVDSADPAVLYELLAERFDVEADEGDENFGGFGGTVSRTIAFIAKSWDGKTLRKVPAPPKEAKAARPVKGSLLGKIEAAAAFADDGNVEAAHRQLSGLLNSKTIESEHAVAYARALRKIATAYQKKKQWQQVERFAFTAYSVLLEALPPDHPDLAEALCAVGIGEYQIGRATLAADYLERALVIFRTTRPASDAALAATAESLAKLRRELEPDVDPQAPRIYRIDTKGAAGNPRLAFVEREPAVLSTRFQELWATAPFSKPLPAPLVVSCTKATSFLAPLIGNGDGHLIVNGGFVDALKRAGAKFETAPVVVQSATRRVLSKDYFLVHPLTSYAAGVRAEDELDLRVARERVGDAPALFRIPGEHRAMFVNEPAARALYACRFPNTSLLLVPHRRPGDSVVTAAR